MNKQTKIIIFIIVFLFIVIIIGNLSVNEPEPTNEPEPVRPTVTSWEFYKKWGLESKQMSGSTQEIPVPKNAIAWAIIVYWDGTTPALKGYGRLIITPGKLVESGAHNDIVYLGEGYVNMN